MNEKQREKVKRHGQNLLAIFPDCTERDPVELCRKLRRLEAKAAAIALRLCNGPEWPEGPEYVDELTDAILAQVDGILCNRYRRNYVPIFVNRDPRGYALKIDDVWLRDQREHNRLPIGDALRSLTTDWGGYGILAPEIRPESAVSA